ncbi:MAG: hypothetical protein ACKOHI_06170, partial [Phycisphaerales bacterium]
MSGGAIQAFGWRVAAGVATVALTAGAMMANIQFFKGAGSGSPAFNLGRAEGEALRACVDRGIDDLEHDQPAVVPQPGHGRFHPRDVHNEGVAAVLAGHPVPTGLRILPG